ncbi:hypothetical protein BAUCODRAFT_194717 [Baudoinia panamericana UAMH 10762]|uniref:Uncharacterized protein n=1 Tax=Baudoinia panamericana (strain UAMH 10762) TaxID=717646 RepID=M2M1Y5_BAUPA|nr:uncharacterized protein BAUCODRAFT_194717 [Baudoinia panamericana UAMH 10762]EMD01078.1 hypothetical protein BAUCODRAFT_194717 [Baudoinia panamericana UAMH 10762]
MFSRLPVMRPFKLRDIPAPAPAEVVTSVVMADPAGSTYNTYQQHPCSNSSTSKKQADYPATQYKKHARPYSLRDRSVCQHPQPAPSPAPPPPLSAAQQKRVSDARPIQAKRSVERRTGKEAIEGRPEKQVYELKEWSSGRTYPTPTRTSPGLSVPELGCSILRPPNEDRKRERENAMECMEKQYDRKRKRQDPTNYPLPASSPANSDFPVPELSNSMLRPRNKGREREREELTETPEHQLQISRTPDGVVECTDRQLHQQASHINSQFAQANNQEHELGATLDQQNQRDPKRERHVITEWAERVQPGAEVGEEEEEEEEEEEPSTYIDDPLYLRQQILGKFTTTPEYMIAV